MTPVGAPMETGAPAMLGRAGTAVLEQRPYLWSRSRRSSRAGRLLIRISASFSRRAVENNFVSSRRRSWSNPGNNSGGLLSFRPSELAQCHLVFPDMGTFDVERRSSAAMPPFVAASTLLYVISGSRFENRFCRPEARSTSATRRSQNQLTLLLPARRSARSPAPKSNTTLNQSR
jgi:hypothetical protein